MVERSKKKANLSGAPSSVTVRIREIVSRMRIAVVVVDVCRGQRIVVADQIRMIFLDSFKVNKDALNVLFLLDLQILIITQMVSKNYLTKNYLDIHSFE